MAPIIRRVLKTFLLEFYIVYGPTERLKLGSDTQVNNAIFNTVSGTIKVGDEAFFGFNVCVLTGRHDYSRVDRTRQDAELEAVNNIEIGRGAWLATNVTVLGPSCIGEWAVVSAGSLVRGDVPPYAVVAGVPARLVRWIEDPSGEGSKPDSADGVPPSATK